VDPFAADHYVPNYQSEVISTKERFPVFEAPAFAHTFADPNLDLTNPAKFAKLTGSFPIPVPAEYAMLGNVGPFTPDVSGYARTDFPQPMIGYAPRGKVGNAYSRPAMVDYDNGAPQQTLQYAYDPNLGFPVPPPVILYGVPAQNPWDAPPTPYKVPEEAQLKPIAPDTRPEVKSILPPPAHHALLSAKAQARAAPAVAVVVPPAAVNKEARRKLAKKAEELSKKRAVLGKALHRLRRAKRAVKYSKANPMAPEARVKKAEQELANAEKAAKAAEPKKNKKNGKKAVKKLLIEI